MSTVRWYLDTSAALKLLVEEPESALLAEVVDSTEATVLSGRLLEVELRRAAHRIDGLSQGMVSDLLAQLDLYEVTPAVFRAAGLLPGAHLRSLDALHLAAASLLGADAVVTYDLRMGAAARELGMRVVAPASP